MRSRPVYHSWSLKNILAYQRDRGLDATVGLLMDIIITYSFDRQQLQVSAQSNYESKFPQINEVIQLQLVRRACIAFRRISFETFIDPT